MKKISYLLLLSAMGVFLSFQAMAKEFELFYANLRPAVENTKTHKMFGFSQFKTDHKSVFTPPFFQKRCMSGGIDAPVQNYTHLGGKGLFILDNKTDKLYYIISYKGLSGNPIMAHFHEGTRNMDGPIVQSICGMPRPNSPAKIDKALGYSPAFDTSSRYCEKGTNNVITGVYPIVGNTHVSMYGKALTKRRELHALKNGLLYVNFHTCLNVLGEARGQIKPWA